MGGGGVNWAAGGGRGKMAAGLGTGQNAAWLGRGEIPFPMDAWEVTLWIWRRIWYMSATGSEMNCDLCIAMMQIMGWAITSLNLKDSRRFLWKVARSTTP